MGPVLEEPAGAVPEPDGPIVRDDPTSIRGIGFSMQRHLNDQGVNATFSWAGVDAEELRRRLGTAGRMAKIED